MGLFVDRLVEAVASLQHVHARLLQAGEDAEALQLQVDLIQPLQEIALDLDGTPSDDSAEQTQEAYYRVAGKVSPRARMRWNCCHGARRTVTRSGKRVWVAQCNWSKGERTGNATRVIASGKRPMPKTIKIGKRVMKRC
jgi:hypothetical protein